MGEMHTSLSADQHNLVVANSFENYLSVLICRQLVALRLNCAILLVVSPLFLGSVMKLCQSGAIDFGDSLGAQIIG